MKIKIKMYNCTVLVPHVREFEFLKACISQIKKFEHPEVLVKIIIADQSIDEIHEKILNLYQNDNQIKILKLKSIDDAGYPIDKGLEICDTDYFCALDSDAFPISNKWLYIPIKLIEKFGLSFVGKETGLHYSYPSLGKFLCINNCFSVAKTSISRDLSKKVGYIRSANRHLVEPKDYVIDDHGDSGVLIQYYSDFIKKGPKLSLNITKVLGRSSTIGLFGMVIEDLIFHMVCGYNFHRFSSHLSPEYVDINNKIFSDGLDDEKINNLLQKTSYIPEYIDKFQPGDLNTYRYYDSSLPNADFESIDSNNEIVKYLISLKNN